MQYVKTECHFLITELSEVLDSPFIDYYENNKIPEFSVEHLVLLRGAKFKPLGNNVFDTELNNKKEFLAQVELFLLADTDLNAINWIFTNELYLDHDFQPVLRFNEINTLKSLFEKNNPVVLSNEKPDSHKLCIFLNLDDFTTEYFHLYFNLEKDQNLIQEFLKNKAEKNFFILHSLTPNEVNSYHKEFLRIAETQDISFENYIRNERCNFGVNLNDPLYAYEINAFFNKTLIFNKKFQEYLDSKNAFHEDKAYSYFIEEATLKIKEIEELLNKVFTNNNEETLKVLSMGRISDETLKIHTKLTNDYYNSLDNSIKYFQKFIEENIHKTIKE